MGQLARVKMPSGVEPQAPADPAGTWFNPLLEMSSTKPTRQEHDISASRLYDIESPFNTCADVQGLVFICFGIQSIIDPFKTGPRPQKMLSPRKTGCQGKALSPLV